METPKNMTHGDVVRISKGLTTYDGMIGGYLSTNQYGFTIGVEDDYTVCDNSQFEYLGFDHNIVRKSDAVVGDYYYILCCNTSATTKGTKYKLIEIDPCDDFSPFKFRLVEGKGDGDSNTTWARIISNESEFSPNGCSSMSDACNSISFISNDDNNTSYLAPQPKALL